MFAAHRVRIDLSAQRLKLWIDEPAPWQKVAEPELRPTFPPVTHGFVPATVLVQKAKQFDDGLYAAVELAAQRGAGRFAGKVSLLRGVVDHLVTHQRAASAIVPLTAAARIGGVATPTTPQHDADIAAETERFLRSEM
jgi:hypothetical protein